MSLSSNALSQKEYLKKYLSGDVKKKKKRKVNKGSSSSGIKRSKIIDDDIDLNSMRPLGDDELELYQMDEEAPQIAGIIDERPEEVKAQEYYNSKRWKVFGGDDGVNIVDSLDKTQHTEKPAHDHLSVNKGNATKERVYNKSDSSECDNSPIRIKKDHNNSSRSQSKTINGNKYPEEQNKVQSSHNDDSDLSPPRNDKKAQQKYNPDQSNKCIEEYRNSVGKLDRKSSNTKRDGSSRKENNRIKHKSDNSPHRKEKRSHNDSDTDNSPPRKGRRSQNDNDSDNSPPRKGKRSHNDTDSDNSPPRKGKRSQNDSDSDNSPPRKGKKSHNDSDTDISPPRKGTRYKNYRDSDNSLPRKEKRLHNDSDTDISPPRKRKESLYKNKSDSDNSPPRIKKRTEKSDMRSGKYNDKYNKGIKKGPSSDSDNSPPRNKSKGSTFCRNYSPSRVKRERFSRSISPPNKCSLNNLHISGKSNKIVSPRLSRKDLMYDKNVKRRYSDSDDSPPRRRHSGLHKNDSSSHLSHLRKPSEQNSQKKKLYIPNNSSSSEGELRSKSQKMKITLDGKQAGLQDAKELRKELSNLKMKEDLMFSKMDASVSGVGAAAIKRDRKTGQIRDLEKEKEIQKEKDAKASVVNEKYSKWGKGLKQVEDAKERAAEALKEMNKPLARYVDDEDLDNFLKAQEREGDPMLDYIKQKQKEATPLVGEKPIYKGPCNPNRFGIRPGHRWDGVVRSNGYEKEWFTHQNARKARDEEAYKWSTSDM